MAIEKVWRSLGKTRAEQGVPVWTCGLSECAEDEWPLKFKKAKIAGHFSFLAKLNSMSVKLNIGTKDNPIELGLGKMAGLLLSHLGAFFGLLPFLGFFRNADSAAKYISAVRWLYDYFQRPITWESRTLGQALRGGSKLESLKVKIKGSIRWALLARMVSHVWAKGEFLMALAFVLASMFLLRCGFGPLGSSGWTFLLLIFAWWWVTFLMFPMS